MKKANFVFWAMLALNLWVSIPSLAQSAQPSFPTDSNAIALILAKMENVYLTGYDRTCTTATLDGLPVTIISIQPDMSHLEAVVFRMQEPTDKLAGYHVQLQGALAIVNSIAPDGTRSQEPKIRNMELWGLPLFASQFRVGDFLPALFLNMRFVSNTEGTVEGNPRTYLTSLLTVGEAKENRELVLEIDKISGLPKGFVLQSLNKKKIRDVRITSYGDYAGKSYGKEAVALNNENGQKSRLIIQKMTPFKSGIFLTSLAHITSKNWQDFCNIE